MPRRAEVQAREVEPDAVYGSPLVTQVINKVMLDGKKSIAEQIVYDALAVIGERTGRPPVEVLEEAIKELTPVLEVRSRRVGGATYQVPVEVRTERRQALAIRWIIRAARTRSGRSMAEKLAAELLDAANNTGATVRGLTVVKVDPDRLRSYHASPEEVVAALSAGNIVSPSGNARIQDTMPIVPVNAMFKDPKQMGTIPIRPGDAMIAAEDGVVCVPRGEVSQALAAARARVAKEEQTRKALAGGQLGLDLYGLRAKLAALGVEWVTAADEADPHG